MESTRQLKVGKLIQKEMGDIFQKEGKSIVGNTFITFTKVTVSPDLGVAKIYISLLLTENKQDTVKLLSENTKSIRKWLGERIRNQVRIIPHIIFYHDDNLDYAAKMDEIFSKLNIPKAPEEKPKKDEEDDDE